MLTVRRRNIAGATASSRLYRCFPAGLVWLKCAAGNPSLTACCSLLCCCLTLAVRLSLGCTLLGRALAVSFLVAGLLFLLGVILTVLCPSSAIAGASSRLGRRAGCVSWIFSSAFGASTSRPFACASTFTSTCRRFSCQPQCSADTICRTFCRYGQRRSEHCVSNHARQGRFVARDSRVQANTSDDFIRFFCYFDDTHDEDHPKKPIQTTGNGGYH